MLKESAGILLYRFKPSFEIFLVHPGGPFFRNKDAGAWSIPKGELEAGELPLPAALRELEEETGIRAEGWAIELEPVKQKSGKLVRAWAMEDGSDAAGDPFVEIRSNTFRMVWPPGSGIEKEFPEIDRAAWFTPEAAGDKINPAQLALVRELCSLLEVR